MQTLRNLTQKEVTRKEFLATAGFGVLSLLGFSGVLSLLGRQDPLRSAGSPASYGSSAYGGRSRRA